MILFGFTKFCQAQLPPNYSPPGNLPEGYDIDNSPDVLTSGHFNGHIKIRTNFKIAGLDCHNYVRLGTPASSIDFLPIDLFAADWLPDRNPVDSENVWWVTPSTHGGYWIYYKNPHQNLFWQCKRRDAKDAHFNWIVIHPDGADDWETFYFIKHKNGSYSIWSYSSQKFVTAHPPAKDYPYGQNLIADCSEPREWQSFCVDAIQADPSARIKNSPIPTPLPPSNTLCACGLTHLNGYVYFYNIDNCVNPSDNLVWVPESEIISITKNGSCYWHGQSRDSYQIVVKNN